MLERSGEECVETQIARYGIKMKEGREGRKERMVEDTETE